MQARIPTVVFFSSISPHIIVLYHIIIIIIYTVLSHWRWTTGGRAGVCLHTFLRASERVRRVGLTAVKLGPYWTIGRVIYSGTTVGRVGRVGACARVSQKWHLRAAAVVTIKGPLVAADVTNRQPSLIKSHLPPGPARRRPVRGPTTLAHPPTRIREGLINFVPFGTGGWRVDWRLIVSELHRLGCTRSATTAHADWWSTTEMRTRTIKARGYDILLLYCTLGLCTNLWYVLVFTLHVDVSK